MKDKKLSMGLSQGKDFEGKGVSQEMNGGWTLLVKAAVLAMTQGQSMQELAQFQELLLRQK